VLCNVSVSFSQRSFRPATEPHPRPRQDTSPALALWIRWLRSKPVPQPAQRPWVFRCSVIAASHFFNSVKFPVAVLALGWIGEALSHQWTQTWRFADWLTITLLQSVILSGTGTVQSQHQYHNSRNLNSTLAANHSLDNSIQLMEHQDVDKVPTTAGSVSSFNSGRWSRARQFSGQHTLFYPRHLILVSDHNIPTAMRGVTSERWQDTTLNTVWEPSIRHRPTLFARLCGIRLEDDLPWGFCHVRISTPSGCPQLLTWRKGGTVVHPWIPQSVFLFPSEWNF